MNGTHLYEKVQRVPEITDEQIADMLKIVPTLQYGNMYRTIKGYKKLDPRNVSFIWDAMPTGREYTFHVLEMTHIVTQHRSSVFFKPSLAEVYSWICLLYTSPSPRD